jgi:predicted transcriptional regulator of viral defense system
MTSTKERQSFTPLDAEVIGRARQKRLASIVLRRDRDWLKDFSPNPTALVSRMANRGALVALGGGRYSIPEVGDRSTPAWSVALDAELAPLGPYYVGFMTALEGHRLVDLDEPEITVAIGFHNTRIERQEPIADRPLRITTMPPRLLEFGLERVRPNRELSYPRSDFERTLIDCHQRPRMVGSPETWIRAWAQAFRSERVDLDLLLDYSLKMGATACRRTGVLLSLLGHGEAARDAFPARVRRADRTVSLLAGGPTIDDEEIDPYWRVAFNIRRGVVEGWLAYGR